MEVPQPTRVRQPAANAALTLSAVLPSARLDWGDDRRRDSGSLFTGGRYWQFAHRCNTAPVRVCAAARGEIRALRKGHRIDSAPTP